MSERNKLAEYYDAELANVTGQLFDAINEIKRLKAERLKLDKRIHNQRVALRSNWEIIEARAAYKKAWYRSPLLTSILIKSSRRPQPWWKRHLSKIAFLTGHPRSP